MGGFIFPGHAAILTPAMAHFAEVPDSDTHRRWVRRVVIGINIVLAVTLVAAISAVGYALFLYGKLDRLALGLGGRSVQEPINILIVGSDSRSEISKDEKKSFGRDVGGQRSDTIMLAHLDPDKKTVSMVSFPRDLYLPIHGTSGKAKINSAFEEGKNSTEGAKTLIDTIQDNFDVRIDHYVQVDFNGFRSIVDSIGGVNVYFPNPVRDSHSGLNFKNAGCIRLYGDASLAYVRSRYYQEKINGAWRSDGRSDIGRIERQQDFMKRVASRAVKSAGNSPLTSEKLVRNGLDYVKVDNGFSVKDLAKLANQYRHVNPETIQTLGSIPGTLGRAGSASVILPDYENANAMLAAFRADGGSAADVTSSSDDTTVQTPAFKPNEIKVKVLNGSGIDQQAANVANQLKAQGFSTMGFGPADSFSYTKTVIRYDAGEQAKALYIQKLIKGPSVLQQATVAGSDLEIVTGSSFGGLSTVSTTSTTAKSSSSTTANSTNSSLHVGGTTPTTKAHVGGPTSTKACTP